MITYFPTRDKLKVLYAIFGLDINFTMASWCNGMFIKGYKHPFFRENILEFMFNYIKHRK